MDRLGIGISIINYIKNGNKSVIKMKGGDTLKKMIDKMKIIRKNDEKTNSSGLTLVIYLLFFSKVVD